MAILATVTCTYGYVRMLNKNSQVVKKCEVNKKQHCKWSQATKNFDIAPVHPAVLWGPGCMAGDANCSTHMKTYSIVDAAILGKTNLAFAFAYQVRSRSYNLLLRTFLLE